MLIVATNLRGRRTCPTRRSCAAWATACSSTAPNADGYAEIFRRYAKSADLTVPDGLLSRLLQRYGKEGRELRRPNLAI